MIHADFESILVPENNGKQIPEESYTNKYQKHVACSYGYKLMCVDVEFSKTFKTYLGKNSVCNFISSMIEESKFCNEVIKKHFNKQLVMTKEGNEDFKNSTECLISESVIVIMLILMLKYVIIVISLENIEALHIEIVLSILN